MRKELGKWLLDIAKYLVTAVLLASVFGDIEDKWIVYVVASYTIIITLGFGLYLVQEKRRKENEMGAIIMCSLVSAIAIVVGLYFYIQDKKETKM